MSLMKKMLKALLCQRVVNGAFVLVCIASAMGCPIAAAMWVSAALYALLVWLG